jgi:hypothetical protein
VVIPNNLHYNIELKTNYQFYIKIMFKIDKPVIIDNKYLLTTVYYNGRNSIYYNAVLI